MTDMGVNLLKRAVTVTASGTAAGRGIFKWIVDPEASIRRSNIDAAVHTSGEATAIADPKYIQMRVVTGRDCAPQAAIQNPIATPNFTHIRRTITGGLSVDVVDDGGSKLVETSVEGRETTVAKWLELSSIEERSPLEKRQLSTRLRTLEDPPAEVLFQASNEASGISRRNLAYYSVVPCPAPRASAVLDLVPLIAPHVVRKCSWL
jgi:hypothetical protein